MKYQNFTDFLSALEAKYEQAYGIALGHEKDAMEAGLAFTRRVRANIKGFDTRDLYDAVLRSFSHPSPSSDPNENNTCEKSTVQLQEQIAAAGECQKKIASIERVRKQ